jgi:hypothetical protein
MKPYLLCLTLTLLSACSTLKSDLTVRPGTQFRLGGNQQGIFTVSLKNTGQVPVTVSEQSVTGQSVVRGTFQPGESKTVNFAKGSAAVVDNASDKSARLTLVVTGDKDLSMQEVLK